MLVFVCVHAAEKVAFIIIWYFTSLLRRYVLTVNNHVIHKILYYLNVELSLLSSYQLSSIPRTMSRWLQCYWVMYYSCCLSWLTLYIEHWIQPHSVLSYIHTYITPKCKKNWKNANRVFRDDHNINAFASLHHAVYMDSWFTEVLQEIMYSQVHNYCHLMRMHKKGCIKWTQIMSYILCPNIWETIYIYPNTIILKRLVFSFQ